MDEIVGGAKVQGSIRLNLSKRRANFTSAGSFPKALMLLNRRVREFRPIRVERIRKNLNGNREKRFHSVERGALECFHLKEKKTEKQKENEKK